MNNLCQTVAMNLSHTEVQSGLVREWFAKIIVKQVNYGGCPGVPVHEGIPFVFITIHGVMTQFVNVSFLCVPVHQDTTELCV